MFTGIVTALGTVREVQPIGGGHDLRLVIGTSPAFLAEPAPAALGASIACSGVCLTVVHLAADAFSWLELPESAVNPGYITLAAMPNAVEDMTGSVARSQFLPGDPIRAEKLAKGTEGFLPALLSDGLRGVSVAITADSASGGFITPDNHVDVVLTRSASSDTGGTVSRSETILHNVRVLAINSRLGAPEAEAAQATPEESMFADNALATLELDQAQSELIINAANGNLSLVLRATADTTTPADAEREAINQSIRLTSPFWLKPAQPGSSGAAAAYPSGT